MSKTRLSVPLSETLYNNIKEKSESMGISMSSYVTFIVSNALKTETQVMNELSKLMETILEKNPSMKDLTAYKESNKADDEDNDKTQEKTLD